MSEVKSGFLMLIDLVLSQLRWQRDTIEAIDFHHLGFGLASSLERSGPCEFRHGIEFQFAADIHQPRVGIRADVCELIVRGFPRSPHIHSVKSGCDRPGMEPARVRGHLHVGCAHVAGNRLVNYFFDLFLGRLQLGLRGIGAPGHWPAPARRPERTAKPIIKRAGKDERDRNHSVSKR